MIDYFSRSNIPFAALAYVTLSNKPRTQFLSNFWVNNLPKTRPKSL